MTATPTNNKTASPTTPEIEDSTEKNFTAKVNKTVLKAGRYDRSQGGSVKFDSGDYQGVGKLPKNSSE